jgi:hypothetical protein
MTHLVKHGRTANMYASSNAHDNAVACSVTFHVMLYWVVGNEDVPSGRDNSISVTDRARANNCSFRACDSNVKSASVITSVIQGACTISNE